MDLLLHIDLPKIPDAIDYRHKILLTGSCFTEHIGSSLEQLKFQVIQNPNGILFGPDSVCRSLVSYAEGYTFSESDLFPINETWHSWQHHSRFSSTDKWEALDRINKAQRKAHEFLKEADWVLITLGSSFTYRLTEAAEKGGQNTGSAVANCHRAPASWFTKEMLEVEPMENMIGDCIERLLAFNPKLRFIFTVSPVRHIRDGVVANNRSKGRLLEAIHRVVDATDRAYYFPAYELVIDVLRDYRFYDIDLVHPNYAATRYVFERFSECSINEPSRTLMEEVQKIVIARKHRAFQPKTRAHQSFLESHYTKTRTLLERYPYLDLSSELAYFSQESS